MGVNEHTCYCLSEPLCGLKCVYAPESNLHARSVEFNYERRKKMKSIVLPEYHLDATLSTWHSLE